MAGTSLLVGTSDESQEKRVSFGCLIKRLASIRNFLCMFLRLYWILDYLLCLSGLTFLLGLGNSAFALMRLIVINGNVSRLIPRAWHPSGRKTVSSKIS